MRGIMRWGFYQSGGKNYHCYAIAVDAANLGQPPPPEAFTPGQPNLLVYTDGSCSSWTITAAHVLLALGCDAPTTALCQERIAAWGPPAHWGHACWWSVR